MKKVILALAATTTSLFILLPARHVWAADFGFTVGENYNNSTSTPISSGFYLYQNIVNAQGQVTGINGFSSLQGVNPSNLTFNFGNLQLLNYQENPSRLTVNFGSNGQQTPYFNLLENGQVIATSNQITLTDTSANSFYVPLTQKIDVTLNGVISNPFYQEVNQLTNGTDVLEFNGTTPNGTGGFYGSTFTFSGDAAPSSLTTPSTTKKVTEPTTILGFGAVLIISSMLKRKCNLEDV